MIHVNACETSSISIWSWHRFSGLASAKCATELFLKELPFVFLVSSHLRACSAFLIPWDLLGTKEGRVHQCEGKTEAFFWCRPVQNRKFKSFKGAGQVR